MKRWGEKKWGSVGIGELGSGRAAEVGKAGARQRGVDAVALGFVGLDSRERQRRVLL